MDFLKKLFGMKTKDDYKQLVQQGATIIDVRTPAEFHSGHPKGALNIPLQNLENKIKDIKKMKQPILVCCASGMRSASAKAILEKHGIEVHNAGPWTNLNF
jgi:rhodanese-related sulfurtransferase